MLAAGDQIDVWIVERALGSGGMGSVYRCRNRNANRISAAVKVLDSDLRRFPEAEARFIREAEILFRLDHPSIVKVRNVRTDIDPPFLEMEFVEGESLEDVLARGPLPVERALPLIAQLASALAYLHGCGIRHRDIKPANVLIKADGRLKVVDFGLAMEAGASRLTQNNLAFGTVSYAPPEWLAPETLDPARWDVYAAGVVFYEMLTGKVAFPVGGVGSARQQAAQVIFAKQGHAPLDPGEGFPEPLRALIRDATHSDAAQRIPDGQVLLDRVRAANPEIEMPTGWNARPPAPSVPPRPPGGETLEFTREGSAPTKDRMTVPTPPRREVSAPPARRRWMWAAGVGMGLGILGLVTVLTVTAVVWALSAGRAPGPRPVTTRVVGVPDGVPVAVRLGGSAPTAVDGRTSTFSAAPGAVAATWTVGEGCEACPGEACPPWCGVGEQRLDVPAGEGPWAVDLAVAPPVPRRVALPLPSLDPAVPVAASVGDALATREGDALVLDLPPGRYPLDLVVGTCPADAKGCFPDRSCPAGCVSHVGALVVPWGAGPWEAPLSLPAPGEAPAPAPASAAPQPAPTPAPAAAPAPTPAPAAGASGSLVTVGQFAKWLAENPDWQPEVANLGANYLSGWVGAAPPEGARAGSPITGVTWRAASTFCAGRGGLPGLDAAPTRWDGDPVGEWRKTDEGKFAYRMNDGEPGTAGSTNRAMSGVGFRCAR